ncbi:MAG: V-type ATP synthase subunit I [Promethearchaeota archaeon]
MMKTEDFGRLIVILDEKKLGALLNMLSSRYTAQIKDIEDVSNDIRKLEDKIEYAVGTSGDLPLWEYKFRMMEKKFNDIGERLDVIMKSLDIPISPKHKIHYEFHVRDLEDLTNKMLLKTNEIYTKVQENNNNKVRIARELAGVTRASYVLETLALINFKRAFIRDYKFIDVNLLIVQDNNYNLFQQYLDKGGYIFEEYRISEHEYLFIIISTKKQADDVQKGVTLYNCKSFEIEEEYFDDDGTINVVFLEKKIAGLVEKDELLKKEIKDLKKNLGVEIVALHELYLNTKQFLDYHEKMQFVKDFVIAEFWIVMGEWEAIEAEMKETFGRDVYVRFHPVHRDDLSVREELMGDEGSKTEEPPTLLKIPRMLKPFSAILNLYGLPKYIEMNPLIIIAITFPLLFGLMFGDMGQGLGLILFGIFLPRTKKFANHPVRINLCYVIAYCGIGSMFGGLLYGEVFGIHFSEIVAFLNTNYGFSLTLTIFPVLTPLENPMELFRLSIWIGILQISVGLILKAFNFRLIRKRLLILVEVIPKIILLWSGALIFLTIDIGVVFQPGFWMRFPGLIPILMLLILVLGPLIGKAMKLRYMKKETPMGIIAEKSMDVFETILSFLSNVISYARIMAMVMVHLSFMLVVNLLSNQISGGNIVIRSIVYTAGNVLVALVEVLFVTIQTIRLHFYEFFSKFYTGGGKEFVPLHQNVKFSRLFFDNNDHFIVENES